MSSSSERTDLAREIAEDSLVAAIGVAIYLAARIGWDDVAGDLHRAQVRAQRRRQGTEPDGSR
jgi:hypothetical protein